MKRTYTIKDFKKEYPNDDICLEYIFNRKIDKQHKNIYSQAQLFATI